MSNIKKLAAQTLTYGFSSILGRFVNMLLVPIYTAYLTSPADYGVVTVVFTFAAFLNVIFTFGMETAFFNFSRTDFSTNKVFSTAFSSILITGLALAAIGMLFSDYLALVMDYESKGLIFKLLFGILLLDALSAIPFAWLRQQNQARKYVIIKVAGIFINVGLILLLFPGLVFAKSKGWIGFDPEEYFISNIFWSNLTSSAFVLLLLFPIIKSNGFSFQPGLLRKMLGYGLPLILVGFAGIINETLDRILLKFMLPPEIADTEVGIYSAFYKISLVITLFIQSFRYAAEPFFFNESKNKNPQKTYSLVMDYFVWVCGFMMILTIVFTPFIAKLIIRNSAYFEDGRGLMIVPILLLANLFLGVYYNLSIWYKLSGKTMMGGVLASAGAVLTIVLNIILIPKLGFVGSAWATLGAYFGMTLISYIVGQKYYPVPYSVLKLGLNFLFLFGVVIWLYFVQPHQYWIVISTIVYFVFFWIIERPDKNPRLKRLFGKKTLQK